MPKWLQITWGGGMGGGSTETPKLYYVIYEQPLTSVTSITQCVRSTRRWAASRCHGHLPSLDPTQPSPVFVSVFLTAINMFSIVFIFGWSLFELLLLSLFDSTLQAPTSHCRHLSRGRSQGRWSIELWKTLLQSPDELSPWRAPARLFKPCLSRGKQLLIQQVVL